MTHQPSTEGDELRVAGDLEVRADLVGDIDPAFLRARVRGKLIYSLRSAIDGGAFTGQAHERRQKLLAAAEHYDVVDLELDRDLTPKLLARIAPHRRRISWHGQTHDMGALFARFAHMVGTPAQLYLLAPVVHSVQHAIAPLQLLKHLRRSDVTAFGTASAGIWSRLLAPWLGAPVVFGRVSGNPDSVPTVEQLVGDYPFPTLCPVKALFGIVGRSPTRSISPRLHNAAYRTLGISALYLPMPVDDFTSSWRETVSGLRDLGFSFDGATIVSPYKEAALRMGDSASRAARSSGGANLLVARRAGWHAHTTDTVGVLGALRHAGVSLEHRRAAVIGCGGAGRGAAVGLMRAGIQPTMVNRGAVRGRYAASLLGLPYVSLSEFAPEDYSLIVQATPLREQSPFRVERLANDAVILDMTYGPEESALVAAARRRRLVAIDGWAVLRVEVARQFRLMTGRWMPMDDAEAGAAISQHVTRGNTP